MKKPSKILFYVLLLGTIIAFSACKPEEPQEDVPPTLTTSPAQNIEGGTVTLGGTITSEGSHLVWSRGVCWGKNPNPEINPNNYKEANGGGLGSFTVEIKELEPNTIYHVRAYAETAFDLVYGNNISFETGELVTFTTDIVRRIFASSATLSGTVSGQSSGGQSVGGKGFVLSTSPSPTTDDIEVSDGVGSGNIMVNITNLSPNTVYYARPYAYAGVQYWYGEEISFKTAGYRGPAGGYVIFDKGEESDGWQYLETSPQQFQDVNWGCNGTFISNTFPEEGTGLDNTNRIVVGCNQSNCAARKCFDLQIGGASDWFLPSTKEAVIVMRSLDDINSSLRPGWLWTSTESSVDEAYYVKWSGNNIIESTYAKGLPNDVIPIRRY